MQEVADRLRDLFLLQARDDSMEPTIKPGDFLLCSQGIFVFSPERLPRHGLYVLAAQGKAEQDRARLLRRIEWRLDGKMTISCDNPNYGREVWALNEPGAPFVIGPVLWRGGPMGFRR